MRIGALFSRVALSVGVLSLLAAGSALADAGLAQAKGCMTCHHAERKGIGPAYREVAIRYRGNDSAAATLAKKIREGGSGAWGDNVMPPNPHVNEAEGTRLAAWILSLR